MRPEQEPTQPDRVAAARARPHRSSRSHYSSSPGYGQSLLRGQSRGTADQPEIRIEQVQRRTDLLALRRAAWRPELYPSPFGFGVLVRLASGRRLADCFADRFRLFGRRSYSVLRGRRCDGGRRRWCNRSRRILLRLPLGHRFSRRGGGRWRWRWCYRSRRILLHLRLDKVRTRAQKYARNNAQTH